MEYKTIPIRSVTNAMRGKRILEKNGFSVLIQRSFHAQDNNGCGYRLLVKGDEKRARELLTNAGFRLKDGEGMP